MTAQPTTCTKSAGAHGEVCGGEIRPSYSETPTIIDALSPKGEQTHPAACQRCGKTYADVIAFPMTLADLDMVGDRLSKSTQQELRVTATELSPGCYEVELTEDRARDLASKSANLGLTVIANKVRQELNGLTSQRRQR
jgi:hypothetical protein